MLITETHKDVSTQAGGDMSALCRGFIFTELTTHC